MTFQVELILVSFVSLKYNGTTKFEFML